jgi:hypothetical protein
VPDELDLVVCDASFIPMRKVLPAAMALCGAEARLVALIKPQFEAQQSEVSDAANPRPKVASFGPDFGSLLHHGSESTRMGY